jgi:hypothetical protein
MTRLNRFQQSHEHSVSSALVVLDQRSPRGGVHHNRTPPPRVDVRQARTHLDPARGSSSACAPSLFSSSSTGNRGRDLRRRSVTMVISASGPLTPGRSAPPPHVDRFTCVTGSSLRIFLWKRASDTRIVSSVGKKTRVELWLGHRVTLLGTTPFTACRRCLSVCNWERYWWQTRIGRRKKVRRRWRSAGCRQRCASRAKSRAA